MAKSKEDKELDELSNEFGLIPEEPKKAAKAEKKPVLTPEEEFKEAYKNAPNKKQLLVRYYLKEEKVPVTISPLYSPHLGRVAKVQVNGIMVEIPADGNTYMINKTHAEAALTRIRKIDAMTDRLKRASQIQNNIERLPGELKI